jgi:malate dehydrogenase (oxaloacetate-decarboxylating)
MKVDYNKESLKIHKKNKGKLGIISKVSIKTKDDLSIAYTPGVAEPCREIAKDKEKVYEYTPKGNTVAIVSDGSAVLGLGNIGAEAAIPVMEGKAILLKEFGNVDAFPICIKSQDPQVIIETVRNISPVFGGINLEDIKAPECFIIEDALQDLGIPVMHDDQHGTAIVVLAATINALKVVNKRCNETKIVVNGAGAAGMAITKLLISYGFNSKKFFMCDSKGIICSTRNNLNTFKQEMAKITNGNNICGSLTEALKGADIFIGVSKANLVSKEMVQSMNKDAIVIAMANPVPEIMPDLAREAGAKIVATGRSDFPNQVNNSLAFPGVFRGALDARATRITLEMKLAAAKALANMVKKPSTEKIIPGPFDEGVAQNVAKAVKKAWKLEEIK